MNTTFTVRVRGRRDVLVAQVRARQLCRMLGFAAGEQALFVARTFELASKSISDALILTFQVRDHRLEVSCAPKHRACGSTGSRSFGLALPERSMAVEDIFWALEQIQSLARPDLFAELRQQNEDLLRALNAEPARTAAPGLRLVPAHAA